VARLLALASADDTPDSVRDQALRRVGELPRKQVIDALYAMFAHENWKVRWVAAELVLKMSETAHLSEFMSKLGSVRQMAITEPIRYGKLIAALPGAPPARELIGAYAAAGQAVPVRLTALGYYLEHGTQAELAALERQASDTARVPECAKDAQGCEWRCEISSDGQQLVKPVQTLGDFMQYCVKPAIMERAAADAAAQKTAKN
jgi:HEAT repeat protein